ncbi:hypothetical protein, partial [Rhodopseudomonas parapalustris]
SANFTDDPIGHADSPTRAFAETALSSKRMDCRVKPGNDAEKRFPLSSVLGQDRDHLHSVMRGLDPRIHPSASALASSNYKE